MSCYEIVWNKNDLILIFPQPENAQKEWFCEKKFATTNTSDMKTWSNFVKQETRKVHCLEIGKTSS